MFWVIGHMEGRSKIWKPRWWSIGVKICHHCLWRPSYRVLRVMILILTFLWTPIGIRRIVPVVVLVLILTPILLLILIVRPVIMIVVPIIAIVTTTGSLILRIESIVACQSYVIVLETNLTLDWASTAATTTSSTNTVKTASATTISTTKTSWIWKILICIHNIGVGVRIPVVTLIGVRQTRLSEIYCWREGITWRFESGVFAKM